MLLKGNEMRPTVQTKSKKKKTMRKAKKVASDGTVLYVRNLPIQVADTLRTHAKSKRQSIAGVIIELVEFAKSSNHFVDENSH